MECKRRAPMGHNIAALGWKPLYLTSGKKTMMTRMTLMKTMMMINVLKQVFSLKKKIQELVLSSFFSLLVKITASKTKPNGVQLVYNQAFFFCCGCLNIVFYLLGPFISCYHTFFFICPMSLQNFLMMYDPCI